MMNKLALIATRSLRKPVLSPPALAFQRVFFLSTHKGSGTDLREQAKHVVVNNSRDSNTTESALDKEKKLYKLKRSLSDNYSRGDYEKALSDAVDLREKAYELYGPQNAVVASAINNVALMQKMLGNLQAAMDNYVEALQLYDLVAGKKSISYAATLANLGTLYKTVAIDKKGMEKLELLENAQQAFTDALATRKELLGATHRETLSSEMLLANLLHSRGNIKESLDKCLRLIPVIEEHYGSEDLLTATIYNNTALLYKSQQLIEEAKKYYNQAYDIRSKILGDKHPETIIVMHNLAECLLASKHAADQEAAGKIQELIISLVEPTEPNTVEEAAVGNPSPQVTINHSKSSKNHKRKK